MAKVRASRALENVARRFGIAHVAGVDEVGRGCLAGPVVAAAVILHPERHIPGVADSKMLSAETRERLSAEIIVAAVAWSISVIEAPEIDRLNIHKASLHAMHQAVMGLVPLPGLVLIDGFRIPQLMLAQRSLVGGDRRVSAIAAASIVAKVHRDQLMRALHERDPRYGFDRHKGYATADHLAAVDRCGYSAEHRRTFRPPTLFDLSDTIPE
ncbi:MAG: ribonuclease HII [Vicinamibacterales bacterium]